MKKSLSLILLFVLFSFSLTSFAAKTAPKVKLETTMGNVVIELNQEKAPISVENFLGYVRDGFYDGTIFHRVISNFMVQGGGFTADFNRKDVKPAIKNEANNGLQNTRGTVAMARTSDPHSATAQFFINVVDNSFLDFRAQTRRGWGYAVFGRVIEGMDVVDKIRKTRTGPGGPFGKDVPQESVIITKASIID
ncbi:MAG: peptidylprolyl isomerase [Gammaproteobacteria bacterium]|nr:peptidylprolyl isomerase [Gammaproteobacteria bacterium]